MFEGLLRDQSTAHVHRVGVASRSTGDWLTVASEHAPPGYDATRDGVCIHRAGTVLYIGPGVSRLLGVEDTVIGSAIVDLFEPAERTRVADLVAAAAPDHPATLAPTEIHRFPLTLTAIRASDATTPVDVLYVCAAAGEERTFGGERSEGRDGTGKAGRSRSATVLICDDEARLGALTAGLLADFGFTSVTVENGEAALEALSGSDPSVDVVLLDVNLSDGASAHEVLSAMKARGSTARVILTSGLAEEDVDTELLTHPSVVGYVAKPYGVEQLVQSVRSAVARGS